jgi:hypothetical protein
VIQAGIGVLHAFAIKDYSWHSSGFFTTTLLCSKTMLSCYRLRLNAGSCGKLQEQVAGFFLHRRPAYFVTAGLQVPGKISKSKFRTAFSLTMTYTRAPGMIFNKFYACF